ncbi:transporter substrate-binding domain-containing protein [Anaeromicrobium sediminis]|uniref:transporter substrate-binding domain-containing protein n=1 Tax=Anaeromicrobium sediminis TaxID=1478221 RepID=UPI00159547AD|nr:transporter substrate-binding domain-containing protein [Anaeromicrobium sediminis]
MLILICATSVAYSEEIQSKTIVIGGDNNFPPFEYVDKNGVAKGFNVDLIRAIAIEMGLDVEIKLEPWFKTMVNLNSDQIHAIEGMKYSEDRDLLYDFSEPYLQSSQTMFVNVENTYIVHLQDLRGQRVAIQKNDIAIDLLNEIENIHIIEFENQEMALKSLITKEVDVYIGNRLTGLYNIQRSNYREYIKMVGEEINPKNYCIAVKKGNEEIISIFNEGLREIKSNGTYDKIYKKWFGERINLSYEIVEKIIYGLLAGIILSLILIFNFYRWNYVLKNEVNLRTQELQKELIFKEQILDSIFSGLITIDKDENITLINKRALCLLKISKNHLIGKNINDTIVKDHFPIDKMRQVLGGGKEIVNLEKNICMEEKEIMVQYNIYPINYIKEKTIGVTLTFKDITKESILRKEIMIKDKLEALGRMVASIAHEIRNPLTAIKAYVDMIPYKYENEEFRKRITKDVPLEIERLDKLITSLLDYSKPKVTQKKYFLLNEEMDNIIILFKAFIRKMKIDLKINVEEDIYIYFHKEEFRQIIINLLLNSLEALKDVEEPIIHIRAYKEEEKANITLYDNGCGIEKKDLERIFEPFFTTREKGSGLGLFTSYRLIKENEGTLYVESEKKVGTKVKIQIPIKEEL